LISTHCFNSYFQPQGDRYQCLVHIAFLIDDKSEESIEKSTAGDGPNSRVNLAAMDSHGGRLSSRVTASFDSAGVQDF
jgi:hypothetical protein